jgi:mxaA protein
MDYQLINAPQALMNVNLPAVGLKPSGGGEQLVIPEWPVSITPLTPRAAFAKGGLQELRPDHPPPALPTLTLRRNLEIWIGACVLVVAVWAGWWGWRQRRAAASHPFARALRKIRVADESGAPAWLEMHKAFDRTAGQAVQLGTLAVLFRKAPHFAAERAAIEQFFRKSSERFYGGKPAVLDGTSLRGLCSALRRLEKRHE